MVVPFGIGGVANIYRNLRSRLRGAKKTED